MAESAVHSLPDDRISRLPKAMALLLPVFIFSAFLTQVKFIPGVRNNIGPFEILGGLIIVSFLAVYRRPEIPLRLHTITKIVAALVLLAAVSQTWLPPSHARMGLVQTGILVFLLLFLVAVYNLILQYQVHPAYVLRLIALSLLIVGPWVIWSGVQAGGDFQAAGPFRNRAHMGSYMLSGFWLVLLYTIQPNIGKLNRLLSNGALCLALYGVAVSGRRSVYLSLIVGLFGLAVGFLLTHRGKRLTLIRSGAVALGFLAAFYTVGAIYVPQAAFFQERVGMIGQRLEQAFAKEEQLAEDDSFFVLQRQGVMMAYRERPVFGIGWGGFAKSRYSPTGHEVHSTPLRFLAEMGLVGLSLYIALMAYLLIHSLKLFFQMRRTAYGGVYLVLMMGLWSLSISYIYNRHVTERTFWLLLLIFLVFETFARSHLRDLARQRTAERPSRRSSAAAAAAAPARPSWSPGRPGWSQPAMRQTLPRSRYRPPDGHL